jgi:uncharacterized membrane protein
MDWAQFAVQWLHVFLGIFWFGSTLYISFILIPALNTLSLSRQREVGVALSGRGVRIIEGVAMAVIFLGVIRGTVFGPIKSVDAFQTAYGITWVVALVAAVATFVWGSRVISPALARLNSIDESAALDGQGKPTPRLEAAVADVKRKAGLELLGFVVIFTCMILMRFGL